jgi:hypothetical protein
MTGAVTTKDENGRELEYVPMGCAGKRSHHSLVLGSPHRSLAGLDVHKKNVYGCVTALDGNSRREAGAAHGPYRPPDNSCRLHRHVRDSVLSQPLRELQQVRRHCAETAGRAVRADAGESG